MSDVWNFFQKIRNNNNVVILLNCQLCEAEYGSSTSTSTLYQYLKGAHSSTHVYRPPQKSSHNFSYTAANFKGRSEFTIFTKKNKSFLGITIHCITNDWKIKKCLLDFISLEGFHSAELILTKLTNVLQEFNISDRIISLTTDNGSNMLACRRELASELEAGFFNFTFIHNRCAAHIINLAVKAGMKYLDSSIIKL
ncbi:zinc finger BED domain-containing protein RICESLEEPER 2-like [Rhizophagus clarus]|uniref:Zinc finger BED domain-containing protein RICESLEEPER 2-like n=1 Tax=Rhizophagus clarus TaxID=94130 RepID=A0A8H3R1G2_9GLOM|nr:zinc finger BED domain-containing protein RICESLEEPER 2-like [Rhizophagus clarus]